MRIWDYLKGRKSGSMDAPKSSNSSSFFGKNIKDGDFFNFLSVLQSVKCIELCKMIKERVLKLRKYRGLKECFSKGMEKEKGKRLNLFIGKCFEVISAMLFSERSWNVSFQIEESEKMYDCDLHDKLLNSVDDGYGSIEYFGWPLIRVVAKKKEKTPFVFCKAKVLVVSR